jgi:gluconokinase
MGASGVGKSTVAKGLSTLMRWPFAEGDAFHPEANLAKMSSGQPLTDEDRWPWLRSVGDWMSQEIAAGRSGTVTCSALRRTYRDLLREGRPEVVFCHLAADEDLVANRIGARQDHFMPPALLHGQYEALEPLQPDEPGVEVSVEGSEADVITRAVVALHLHPQGEGSWPSTP